MIPVKLTLRNFMPYRDNVPTLSFEGIHVACLTGDNGHGKSAIFDAITWALWGRSRAKTDDDLIHLGQGEMMVDFEFEASGQRYRAVRRLVKPNPARSGQSSLEFMIAGDDGFHALTGNSQRDTQAKIEECLHMDYETFINSAFIMQGRADEFTTKPPAQRKEVLGQILGLSDYEHLAERARALSSERKMAAEGYASAIEIVERELARRPEDEAELARIEPEAALLGEQVKTQEGVVAGLRKQNEALGQKKAQLGDIAARISQALRERDGWQSKSVEAARRVDKYRDVMAGQAVIEEGYRQLTATRRENDELNRRLAQLRTLERRRTELEKTVRAASEALNMEHRLARKGLDEAEARAVRLPQLETELVQARQRLTEFSKREEALATARTNVQGLHSAVSSLEASSRHLADEIKLAQEKLGLLSIQDPHCPLCERLLGMEELDHVRTKLRAEVDAKTRLVQANQQQAVQKRKETAALERQVAETEAVLARERLAAQGQVARLEKDAAEAKLAAGKAAEYRQELERLEERMAKLDFAHTEQEALREVEKQVALLGYDEAKHSAVLKRLDEFGRYENLMKEAAEAARGLAEAESAHSASMEAAGRLAARIAEEEEKSRALAAEASALGAVPGELARAEEQLHMLREEERRRRDVLASLQEKVRRYARLQTGKEEQKKLWNKATEEAGIYKELAEAYGKRGIQALLVERAVPEIQDEANRLLLKMTDGRMALALETQRPSKSRKDSLIETLDIRVSDELGTRNYEMFSGGEAFRINLALRIALSRLLVNRSGASLPTLIIDEGFGTQDNSGREKLIEAIKSIEDDFRMIIVITHLEDMKEAFATRINVTKLDGGATIEVT